MTVAVMEKEEKKVKLKTVSNDKTVEKPSARALQRGVKMVSFLDETRQEIRKVSWPTRKYVSSATVIILVIVFVVSFVVSLLDVGFEKLIQLLIG